LYDYGPVMTAININALNLWRSHFVLEESMLEIATTCLTPEDVFISSGHVQRFNDVMTKDIETGECFRLDTYLAQYCARRLNDPHEEMDAETRSALRDVEQRVAIMGEEEMAATVTRFGIRSPKGNALQPPFRFNLMFQTQIGPEGQQKGYLRPELAQGIFMNFKKMYDFNGGRMPFAGAAVGSAFRNEIAPRGGLVRLREFQLAEIEHFMNPNDKDHPKFGDVRDLEVPLWPREQQEATEDPILLTLGEAVDIGMVDNPTLAYFMGRVYLYLKALGAVHVRFRQHRSNEMAHYATDCWDAELLCSGGWLECVGIADRSCYDLEVHSARTGKDMTAFETYAEPQEERTVERKCNKAAIGKAFKGDAQRVLHHLQHELSAAECQTMQQVLDTGMAVQATVDGGLEVDITPEMVRFEQVTKKVTGRAFTPSVIEPSFGIGRILWCVLEQVYYIRESSLAALGDKSQPSKDKRAVFALPAAIAAYKVMVCPLMVKDNIMPHVRQIAAAFARHGIAYKVDDTGVPIGKRYARTDELGVPFCVTVDPTTDEDGTVTIRERDSCEQVRVPKAEVVPCIQTLCAEARQWQDLKAQYPLHEAAAVQAVGIQR